MSARVERLLLLATPMAAMATVALGLRIGAGNAVRAAVVYGAPASGAGTGLAWQIVAFDEEHNYREPAPLSELDVVAREGDREVRWHGATSEDGAVEMRLPFASPAVHLEVRAGSTVLAAGDAAPPPPLPRDPPATAWARFARREGDVVLDVAVAGERVATGIPATLWVRARDAATHAALAGVNVEAERDSAFVPAAPRVTTDARGWARVVATPVGHAVSVVLHATAAGGKTGVWAGGLYISPGAAELALDERVAPGKEPVIDVVVPTMRTTAYLEIDDARGRAWAAAVPVKGAPGELPRATVHAAPLAPGLYWAVAAGDPTGASELGPGTLARPFFVAESDEVALAFGTDRDTCTPPADPRETARAVSECLALAGPTPVPRWTALEGFTMQHARDAAKRSRGLALALGGILLAVILEAVLLLKAAASSRARLKAAEQEGGAGAGRLVGRGWTVGIAVLVAMMGFALMAAFLARVG
ncbi:MAG TPA: hypothetical protein VGL81_06240 [Polyangiaceae bacterium]